MLLKLTHDGDSQDLVDLAGAVLSRQAIVTAVHSRHVLDDERARRQCLDDGQAVRGQHVLVALLPLAEGSRFTRHNGLNYHLGSSSDRHNIGHDDFRSHLEEEQTKFHFRY